MAYNPHTQRYEKRLARYLSWRWRIKAREWEYFIPYRVETLVKAIRLPIDWRFPARTRDRLEKALEKLETDKIIAGFHYRDWTEKEGHGWIDSWIQTSILIEPPDDIVDAYRNIGPRKPPRSDLAERLREKRTTKNLNRLRAAEEIGISPEDLLSVERGIPVSASVRMKSERWLDKSAAS